MSTTQLVARLGRNDVRLIGRDRFLLFMFMFAAYIAIALRYGLPWMNDFLAAQGIMPGATISISLSDIYPMFVAYLGFYTGALLVGTVFGFVLLDEKDNKTLKAMMVTPVRPTQYVTYRVALPAFLAFFVTLGMALFINLAQLPLWQMVLIAAGASLTASIVALFFATFAQDKVQGFAYSKFGGISGWAFLIGWFVPAPWQWLFGLFPPFWVGKAYWLALEGVSWWWVALLVGIVLQLGLIRLLVRRFHDVAYR
jgi:fluoroquinolone transport system permease protein